ncbi:M15 family metallopeptidase [Sphingomonas sp. SRS2]|uniref:M15 family metallopeptidase n=1 Tax=Sphingomonas sp. SRS2 TaxID=133190 RepID=UPI0006184BCE|nr:M15 family metallopeptidase [Sphingomonas sp. SRS2]KKC24445.1 endolysin [Sphingomonas sp. SRS2]
MSIVLGKTSQSRMDGLDPDMRKVVLEAAATAPPELDFMVLEGVRTPEQMMINYGKGRTAIQCEAKGVPARYAQPRAAKVTWLSDPFNSPHKARPTGGRAVDLAPYPIDWNNHARFTALAKHVLATAKRLGIRVRWGKDWDEDGKYEEKGETDGPHFELVR